MKTNLLKAIAFALVMTPLYNCSVEPADQLPQELDTVQSITELTDGTTCTAQDPKSRVTNGSDLGVDFEIHDANGLLINSLYGLNPGEISDWKIFPVGMTTFTISTSESTKSVTIDMGLCMAYDVAIDENNQLDTGTAIQL